MRTIVFNKDSLQQSSRMEEKPSIYLDKIIFKTTDKNWVPKLFTTSLLIKIAGFNEKGTEIKSFQTPIVIGAFISPQHMEPVFSINRRIQFPDDIGTILDSSCA